MILITIASFLDPELPLTIQDCVNKAKNPESLRFAICLQHDYKDISLIDNLPYNISVKKYHYTESKGVGWARQITQTMYNDEEYVLQVDSHTRFIKNWDEIAITELNKFDKAILSFSPPLYFRDNGQDTEFRYINQLDRMVVPRAQSFVGDWWVYYGGFDYETNTNFKNIKVAFSFGGFVFSKGQFIKDVPHDPMLYYWGEEQSMYLRAFTNGYDIYTPSQIVAWHRAHTHEDNVPKTWHVISDEQNQLLNNAAYDRTKEILTGTLTGVFGLGTERTLDDWEKISGVNFFTHTIRDILE